MTERAAPDAGNGELNADEIEAFERGALFEELGELTADDYPRARNVSAAFIYRRVVRALAPTRPECVTVPLPGRGTQDAGLFVAIAERNLLWEAAQFRRRFFAEDQIPAELREIADRGDVNVVFVPRTASRYYDCAAVAGDDRERCAAIEEQAHIVVADAEREVAQPTDLALAHGEAESVRQAVARHLPTPCPPAGPDQPRTRPPPK